MATNATIQDALDYCLLNPEGLGADELLGGFPEHTEELAPLLFRAQNLAEVADAAPPVPVDRRAAMKERFMSAAAAHQFAQQATQSVHEAVHFVPLAPLVGAAPEFEIEPEYTWKPEAKKRKVLFWPRIPRYAWAGAAAVVLLMVSWWTSASSMPDSPFYDVKLAVERLMVNVQFSEVARTQHYMAVSMARVDDIGTLEVKNEIAIIEKPLASYNDNIELGKTEWSATYGASEYEELGAQLSALTVNADEALGRVIAKDKVSAALSDVLRDDIQGTLESNAAVRGYISLTLAANALPALATPTPPISTATTAPTSTRKPTRTSAPSPTAKPIPTVQIILPDTPTAAVPSVTLVPATPQASPTSGKPTAGPSVTVKASPTKAERTVTVAPTVKASPTNTPVPQTATRTHTRIPTGTVTAAPTNTSILAPTPTSTALVQPTNTLAPPTNTAVPPPALTNTPVPPQPTDTPEEEPTNTRVPPPATITPVPPVDTPRATNTRRPPPTPVPTRGAEDE